MTTITPVNGGSDAKSGGVVSFRLARQRTVDAYRRGHRLTSEVCDAQPELRRVAHHHGAAAAEPCPICDADDLVSVLFAFGQGLPKSGRCVTDQRELRRIKARGRPSECYRIEVCCQCWWNHVLESFRLSGTEGPLSAAQ
ncbi:MAG: DUF5318 family protein [Acidimicrobiales bacterium]